MRALLEFLELGFLMLLRLVVPNNPLLPRRWRQATSKWIVARILLHLQKDGVVTKGEAGQHLEDITSGSQARMEKAVRSVKARRHG